MTRESLAFAVSGTMFGLLVGWIIGSQQAKATPPAAQASVATAADASAPPPPQPAPLDEQRAAELERRIKDEPTNAEARAELGNLYFDARRFDQAIPWYEASLGINPRNVNVSTDLAVAYYSTNQVDRALQQIERSLTVDPKHIKTLLNQGIILAFGKQDMAAAARSWERVVEIAPDSEEARLARQGLQGVAAGHGNTGRAAGGAP